MPVAPGRDQLQSELLVAVSKPECFVASLATLADVIRLLLALIFTISNSPRATMR